MSASGRPCCASSCTSCRRSWERTATTASDTAELEKAIEAAGMPPEVHEHARKELKRLQRMNEASPEYGMVRNYLDWLVALPWSKLDSEHIDIERCPQGAR